MGGFVSHQPLQPRPVPDHALMHQVNPPGIADFFRAALEKIAADKGSDDLRKAAGRQAGYRWQFAEGAGTAYWLASGSGAADPLEQPGDSALLLGLSETAQDPIAIALESLLPPSDRHVFFTPDYRTPAPFLPHAFQNVLEDRKMVRIVLGIVQQLLHEGGLKFHSQGGCWTGDGLFLLQASEPGNKIVPVVQGFRQAAELGTLAEVVGTHGENHANGGLALVGCRQPQVHKERAVIAAVNGIPLATVVENFLELINKDKQLSARAQFLQSVRLEVGGSSQGGGNTECPREFNQRTCAGTEIEHVPVSRQRFCEATAQHGNDASPDQRAFPAPGDPGDGNEALRGQQTQQLINLVVAAVEIRGVCSRKGRRPG